MNAAMREDHSMDTGTATFDAQLDWGHWKERWLPSIYLLHAHGLYRHHSALQASVDASLSEH